MTSTATAILPASMNEVIGGALVSSSSSSPHMASSSNESSHEERMGVSLDVEIVVGGHDDQDDDDVDILADDEELDVDLDDDDDDEEDIDEDDDPCDEDEDEVAALLEMEEERMMKLEEDEMVDSFHCDMEADDSGNAAEMGTEEQYQHRADGEKSSKHNLVKAGGVDEADSNSTQQHLNFARGRARTLSIDIDRKFSLHLQKPCLWISNGKLSLKPKSSHKHSIFPLVFLTSQQG